MSIQDRIRGFARGAVIQAVTKVYTGTCMEVAERIAERTPEDTSNAVGNWQGNFGAGSLLVGDMDVRDPGGVTALSVIAAKMPERIAHDMVFNLSNHKKYIRKLEDGHSDQAPNGMVAVTAAEFPLIVAEQVKK